MQSLRARPWQPMALPPATGFCLSGVWFGLAPQRNENLLLYYCTVLLYCTIVLLYYCTTRCPGQLSMVSITDEFYFPRGASFSYKYMRYASPSGALPPSQEKKGGKESERARERERAREKGMKKDRRRVMEEAGSMDA